MKMIVEVKIQDRVIYQSISLKERRDAKERKYDERGRV